MSYHNPFTPKAAERLAEELMEVLPDDGPDRWSTAVIVLSPSSATLTVERSPYCFTIEPSDNGANVRGIYSSFLAYFTSDIERAPETYVDPRRPKWSANQIMTRFLPRYTELCARLELSALNNTPEKLEVQAAIITAQSNNKLTLIGAYGYFYGTHQHWTLNGEVSPNNVVRLTITTTPEIAAKIAELLGKEEDDG